MALICALKYKVNITFEAHVARIESDKSGFSHVAGEELSKGFWVSGGKGEHLFVLRQRRKDPAGKDSLFVNLQLRHLI